MTRPPSGSSLVDALLQESGIDRELRSALGQVQALLKDDSDDRPFLTVLLRTQGRRIEPLKDALLCLAGQTDQDFDVVVIDHDSHEAGAADVRRIVDFQPEFLRSRIRVIEVSGGTRSAPLNAGVEAARGRYVAVYDDDDLLFANWVEAFRAVAGTGGDRLLRAQVATQRVAPEVWPLGIAGFRSRSWPKADYARSFDQIAHLLVNHSPFMSFAFPRTLFTRIGVRFDEELPVCEDWDLILRGSLLLGVDDVPALTSIYRRWEGAASSYTEHSQEMWRRAEKRVIDRLDKSVILLPPGSVEALRKLQSLENLSKHDTVLDIELRRHQASKSWRITAPLRNVRRRIAHLSWRISSRFHRLS